MTALLLILFAPLVWAEDADLQLPPQSWRQQQPNKRASLTLYMENDLFAGTDRYYTSGVKLTYLSADKEREDLGLVSSTVADLVPYFDQTGYLYNTGWALGQNIYTPEDTHVKALQKDDRPYAGWLYLAGSIHHKSAEDVHILELTIGIVGPESQGENAQNTVHQHRGFDEAEGWDNQLSTEPGLILSYDYRWRVFRENLAGDWLQTDFLHTMGWSLGNILTEANTGLTLRLGANLPYDFQSVRIRNTGYASPPDDGPLLGSFSFFIFTGVLGHAVARDIFLDGNTFTDSHSVDKHPFYAEGVVGAGIMFWRLRVTYTQIYISEQFKEQNGGQQLGSLAITLAF